MLCARVVVSRHENIAKHFRDALSRKSGRSLARRARFWPLRVATETIQELDLWPEGIISRGRAVLGPRRRRAALRAMPNPFASQAPLSPAVGGNAQAQRRNAFASSAPLASTGASAGSDGALGPAAGPEHGPPPTSFAGGSAYHAQAHGVAHGGGMYPTPPEMTPPGHLGGSHSTHESGASALARPPLPRGRRRRRRRRGSRRHRAHTVRRLSARCADTVS